MARYSGVRLSSQILREAQIGGSQSRLEPAQSLFQKNQIKLAGDVAQVIEFLPSKGETPSMPKREGDREKKTFLQSLILMMPANCQHCGY
jgi:hypothetical protein